MKPQPLTTKHVLMSCPVCDNDVIATVTAEVQIGAGSYDASKNALDVPVTATPSRFNVTHHCSGRAELAEEATS